jgi:hypothetical protein
MHREPAARRAQPGDASLDVIADALHTSIESDLLVAVRIGGIHAALAYLNARTRYRFTGIYPSPSRGASSPSCRAHLYDREAPSIACEDHLDLRRVSMVVAHLYDSDTETSADDADCFCAPSCVGARLIGADGAVRGTLCHFDHRLRTGSNSEEAVLQFLGARAARWLDA